MSNTFDTQLRETLQAGDEPPDDGFTQRVIAALPARPSRRDSWWTEYVQYAHWAATTVAACGAAALLQPDGSAMEGAQQVAAWMLVGLITLWSVPNRWSRP